MSQLPDTSPSGNLSLVSILLNSELIRLMFAEVLRFWRESRFHGLYRVNHHEATLELQDSQGKVAVHTKRQKVIFLRDDVFAIQDQIWGDGSIFADYKCSPGFPVDIYQEGYRHFVLISLRQNYRKGMEEEVFIERTIENGFLTNSETFQIQVDHPMKTLTARIIFPKDRLPRRIAIVENNLKRSHHLGKEHETHFPDGRISYTWEVNKPRLYEAYIFKWEW